MAKQTNNKTGEAPSRKLVLIAAAVIAVLLIATVMIVLANRPGRDKPEEDGGLLAELSGWSGYARTVSQAEYDFFYELVERDLYAAAGEADVDQLTRDYINKENAKFYLGNRLGLCEPYDFAVMEFRMDQENAVRQATKDSGGTVYGVTQFTLTSYFNYLDSNLETDIVDYLITNADQAMLDRAEEYYNAHQPAFTVLVSITYTLETDGQSATETVDSAGLRTLQNANETLGEFLASAQPGETLDYEDGDGRPCRATLTDVVYETPAFDQNISAAVRTWLNVEIVDSLYETLAQNNPVIFDLDD